MKKIFLTSIFIFFVLGFIEDLKADTIVNRLKGRILIEVESNGEAWYVNPMNLKRYFLGKPVDAFVIMRELSLGISNEDFEKYKNETPDRLKGMILLKVKDYGKAYYVNPMDGLFYYLGRPADAFAVMRKLGLGISNIDLKNISIHGVDNNSQNQEIKSVLHDVPFTSQAPFANWSNVVFQDGCEEASMLMSMKWVRGETLNKNEAEEEIIKISDFEKKNFGWFRDTSIADTAKVIELYFEYKNIEVKNNASKDDILSELLKGNIVIAAMDGQKLGNPYFTPPGPVNHMLVIIGYNLEKDTFITNDPGTKHGQNYEYSRQVLENSIRDYPTGSHEPNYEINKNVIVIKPK